MHAPRPVRSARALLLTAALLTPALLTSPALAQQPATGVVTTPTPNTPAPLSKTELRRVGMLLGDYHNLPTRAALLNASPRAHEVILTIASRRGDAGPYRLRALVALGAYWPDAQSFTLLTTTARDTTEPAPARREAMLALASAFDDRALPTLTPALTSPDLADRLTAVEALRRVKAPAAQTALKAALKTERTPAVRQAIERATRVVE